MEGSRRWFVAAVAVAPFALAGGRSRAEPVCYDPAKLSLSQRSTRRSLNYLEEAPDKTKRCGLCAFYSESAPGCGKCTMLSGYAVRADAVCDSFAPKG